MSKIQNKSLFFILFFCGLVFYYYLCIKIQLQVVKCTLQVVGCILQDVKCGLQDVQWKIYSSMGNYVIKEMPIGMGNGSEGKVFPKLQVYSEFDYDKVVELVNTYSPAFSQGTIRGVLDTLAMVMKSYLPMGHTLKIDNLGVFSLALEFADNKSENEEQQKEQKDDTKKKYCHVRAKDVNFKVDKKMIAEINKENAFERTKGNPKKSSPYSLEERKQRALRHIDKYGFITLQEYANLNELSYSSASRELARLVVDPNSNIKAKGSGSHKVWVRRCKDTTNI